MTQSPTLRTAVLWRCTLALGALLALSACNRDAATPTAAPADAPAAASGAPSAWAVKAAAIKPAPAPPARTPGPIVPPQGPEPVAGKDFEEIAGGAPFDSVPGKIEVVEVFGYVCPACARFAPIIAPWQRKLPADVVFHYVPAPFGPEWVPYAKGYYVAESLGLVERTHDALIEAIHVQKTMPGEGDGPDEQAIANFYGVYGANPKQFLDMMDSFAVSTKVNRGKQFMQRSGVTGTPTVIIDGKYRIIADSYEDVLRIADHLIARERAAMAGSPAAAAAVPAPATPAPAPAG